MQQRHKLARWRCKRRRISIRYARLTGVNHAVTTQSASFKSSQSFHRKSNIKRETPPQQQQQKKNPNLGKNGRKWQKMAGNGRKWPEMRNPPLDGAGEEEPAPFKSSHSFRIRKKNKSSKVTHTHTHTHTKLAKKMAKEWPKMRNPPLDGAGEAQVTFCSADWAAGFASRTAARNVGRTSAMSINFD